MESRIKELESLIRHHQASYYNGEPEITDAEFDLLWDELRRIDPGNVLFGTVGADAVDGFPKREHLMPMGSQDKAADPDAFRAWASKVGHGTYIVQFKLDGASIELQYRDGAFLCGVTRGDGRVGDDITPNAGRMQGVLPAVPDHFTGSVRGEVVMSRRVHRDKYPDKANTRNAANGLMKRKDGRGAEDLTVICYDVLAVAGGVAPVFRTEVDKLEWLRRAGFLVVEYRIFEDAEQVITFREETAARRDELEFDIDGLVVKGPEIDPADLRRARPERQIAFKFELEEAATTLVDVVWNPSGSLYTPIGVLEPVRLAGTTVKRANLVNPRLIRELGLHIGSRVAVTKRGEIIPKIERVLETPPNAAPVEPPAVCEVCGVALVDDDTRLYCPNEACPKRGLYRLRKWLTVLDIRDFGEVILGKLYRAGVVRTVADLYSLSVEQLTSFERMGETLARKILRNLHEVREIPLARFIAGFNIEGVGELIALKAVGAGFNTLEKLRSATAEDLAAVPGIGEITANVIVQGLEALQEDMDAVLHTGAVRVAAPAAGPLAGQSFCFTGTMSAMPRSEAEEIVRQKGGTVKRTVTRDLTYLVTNDPDSGSSKARMAREIGVSTLSEAAFFNLVNAAP